MNNKIIMRPVCVYMLLFLTQAVQAENLGNMLSGYILDGSGRDSAWSVWVGGNLTKNGLVGKLQGRAFVRGNFTVLSSVWNPNELGNVPGGLNVFPNPSLPAMVVGGNVLGPGAVKIIGNLSVQVGSNIASTVTITPANTVVITGGVDYAAADTLRAELTAQSSYWGSLTNTPGATITVKESKTFFTATREGDNTPKMWVFNLTHDLTVSPKLEGFVSGDSILINCNKPGSDETFVMKVTSFSDFPDEFIPQVLWNFPDAATVTISGNDGVEGSILVGNPNSTTTISNPNGHKGRFVSCGSVIHEGGGSFYNYPFTGNLLAVPLSTALDLRVYIAVDGSVMIEVATVNENGNHPIEIYAMFDGDWKLVATVPSEQIIGFGSNTYTVEAFGLTPGESYEFKIVDESGHIFESGLIEVARSLVGVAAMRLTPEMITISFKTTPGLAYQVMVCDELGAPWKVEFVRSPTKKGWSKLNNQPFTAGPDGKTEVLVPRNNRAKAFFKILQED